MPRGNVSNATGQRIGLARGSVSLLGFAAPSTGPLPRSGLAAVAGIESLPKILRRLPALCPKLPVAVAFLSIAVATTAAATSATTFGRALTLPNLVDADAKIVNPGLHPFRRQLLKTATRQRSR